MFPARFYAPYYFAARYWAEVGKDVEAYLRSNLALDFDGSTQYATVPQAVADAIVTEGAVYMWIRPDTASTETGTERKWFDTTGLRAMVRKRTTSGGLNLDVDNRLGGLTATWSAGQWINLVAQWKKSTDTLQVYLDGVSASVSKSGTWGSTSPSGVMTFAAAFNGGNKFDGAIGRVCIWNRVLTESEIALLQRRWPADAASSGRVAEWACGSSLVSLIDSGHVMTLVNSPSVIGGPPKMRKKGIPWLF